MKVEYKPDVFIDELNTGECLVYNGNVYIKTDMVYNGDEVCKRKGCILVGLTNGFSLSIPCNTVVKRFRGKVVEDD